MSLSLIAKEYAEDNDSDYDDNNEQRPNNKPKVAQIYRYPFCYHTFMKGDDFIRHLPDHVQEGQPKPFNCHKCRYSCNENHNLKKHMAVHRKKGRHCKCSQCPSFFLNMQGLRVHETRMHKMDKRRFTGVANNVNRKHDITNPYKVKAEGQQIDVTNFSKFPKLILSRCDLLLKGFGIPSVKGHTHSSNRKYETISASKIKLERSDVDTDTGSRKGYPCTICRKVISQEQNVLRHIRTVHWGERRFKCEQCSKTLASHQGLETHMLLHTGVKAFKCTLCDAAFNNVSNLYRHLAFHRGVKPHKCNMCSRAFTLRQDLDRHIKCRHSS